MKKLIFFGLFFYFTLFSFQNSFADMINLTGAQLSPNVAEYYIEDNRILLKLEIGESDRKEFDELISGTDTQRQKFLKEKFYVLDGRGNKLNGNIILMENRKRVPRPSPITNPPGGVMPSKDVTYIEIEYPFSKKPASVTFNPPVDEHGTAAATVGFIVFHKDIPVIDFRYLPYNQKLNLNWEDPWYSKFENRNLKRHHSSSLMSFLYIEPYEVRHEILVRLIDLLDWLDLGVDNIDKLSVERQEQLIQEISDFIVERNGLKIDGAYADPIVDRVQFVKVNLMGIQYFDQPEEIDKLSAIVGIILVYITDGIPQTVSVEWDMFSDRINNVPAIKSDPAGPFPDFITPEYSTLVWENYLKNYQLPQVSAVVVERPVISRTQTVLISIVAGIITALVILIIFKIRGKEWPGKVYIASSLAGVSIIVFVALSLLIPKYESFQTERHSSIVASLLKNIYRSFDFKDESDIYDKLSTSIDGDLLRDMYLDIRKNLEYENVGGAKAKIQDVNLENISTSQLGDGSGYEYNTDWTVTGKVEHWGHIHNRTNRYNALITVKNIEGTWKITDFQLNEEERVIQ